MDDVAASGTVTFATGETATTVEVTVLGDLDQEPNELILVSFGNVITSTIGGFYGPASVYRRRRTPNPHGRDR